MKREDLVSPCGLYCGVCGIYQAGMNNDTGLRDKLAKAYGLQVEEVACKGCKSDMVFKFCRICKIRTCAMEKNYEGCYQCTDFPCDKIDSFPIPEGKQNIYRAVSEWKRLGTEEWIESEEALFSCLKCGNLLFRGAHKCRKCGSVKE